MRKEHERRVEGMLDDIKQLTKEMRLQELLINYTIPPEFQELIEKVWFETNIKHTFYFSNLDKHISNYFIFKSSLVM